MRTLRLSLLLAAVLLACPPPADAYRILGRWKSSTIRYFNAAPQYAAEVRRAAAAWNRSGARVRWLAVPRRRAQSIIRIRASIPAAGLAYPSDGRIFLRPGLKRMAPGRHGQAIAARIIAHEMGHIIGLDHPRRGCAVMLSASANCPFPRIPWQYRCRILERDDVAGAVHLFGGRIRPLGPAFCPVEAPIPPPRELHLAPQPAAGEDQPGGVRISWVSPRAKGSGWTILRASGSCPSSPSAPGLTTVDTITFRSGVAQSTLDTEAPAGRHCYLVVATSNLGQPGRAATATIDYVPPNAAPVAGFDATPADGLTLDFTDESRDPDGTVVAWSWSFGDGTTAAGPSPSHTYAAPGTYTVTLTVTDDRGGQASTSQQVTAGE